MEFEVSYDFENEQQFWDELHDTVSKQYETHRLIDDALRSYLSLVTSFSGEYVRSGYDFALCSYHLHSSPLFQQNPEYVRKQIVHCLLEDDEPTVLQIAASFLLADARTNEATYELMNKECVFPRLVDLISKQTGDEQAGLHRLLMELLYEMSRVQKIKAEDLLDVSDDFVVQLFKIIEELSDDATDPYHYPVIRVLLVLNEQFLLAAHDPTDGAASSVTPTNKVLKILSTQGSKFKTFGENIILLLNREDETSLQLLTLKLLYLVFTTPLTYEYFYTNDLRVLVDILIRNLLDLPEDSSALRHTYLRVLYPLLSHTQLRHPPQYKRDEIRKLLYILARDQKTQISEETTLEQHWGHFGELDDTTKRLVRRCQSVPWLRDPDDDEMPETESPTDEKSSTSSPTSPSKSHPPAVPAPRKLTKRNSSKGSALSIGAFLTPQLEAARHSSISMAEIAAHREKPGIITPSRNPSLRHNLKTAIMMGKKEKPPVPKARRAGSVASKLESQQHDANTEPVAEPKREPTDSPTSSGRIPEKESEHEVATPHRQQEHHTTSPVPPKPPPHKKRPPPRPRARRRHLLAREDEQHAERPSNREPGKFDTTLPSIRTSATTELSQEISPFSPVEKSLVTPTSPKKVEDPPESVSDALHSAQVEANTGIEEAMGDVQLVSPSTPSAPEPTALASTTTPPPPPPHPQPSIQVSFATSTPIEESRSTKEETTPPRIVLAPPSMAPIRAVPGPRWELERSPFLSEEDPEEKGDDEEAGEQRGQD